MIAEAARPAAHVSPSRATSADRRIFALAEPKAVTNGLARVVAGDTPSQSCWHGSGCFATTVVKPLIGIRALLIFSLAEVRGPLILSLAFPGIPVLAPSLPTALPFVCTPPLLGLKALSVPPSAPSGRLAPLLKRIL